MSPKMKLLEKVWMAEIENRLPFQTKAKLIHKLAEQQLVAPLELWSRSYKPGSLGPVLIKGWQLTHAGRFLYCSTCDERGGD